MKKKVVIRTLEMASKFDNAHLKTYVETDTEIEKNRRISFVNGKSLMAEW